MTNTHFPDHLQTPTFQIVSWLPRNTNETGQPTLKNIYKCNTKPYLKRCILSNKIVCFSSMVFLSALILSLCLLKCPNAKFCSLRLIKFWKIKMVYWRRQNFRRCIFVKSYHKDTTGIIEICSSGKHVTLFLRPYRQLVINYPRVFIATFWYYAIALKFSAEQINLIAKKSASAICDVTINADFTIFVNASHSIFLKKH